MSSESGWCRGGRQNSGQNGGVFSHRSCALTLVLARRCLGFVWLDEVPPAGTVTIRPLDVAALAPCAVLFPHLPEASHHMCCVHVMGEGLPRTWSQLAAPSPPPGLPVVSRVVHWFLA